MKKLRGIVTPVRIAGIPATFVVTSVDKDDFGHIEGIEFTLGDRSGSEAPWLEKKLTPEDREAIFEIVQGQVGDALRDYQETEASYRKYGYYR